MNEECPGPHVQWNPSFRRSRQVLLLPMEFGLASASSEANNHLKCRR